MWPSIVNLLALGTIAAVHIALLLAVLRSTRPQFAPTLLIIAACLLSLTNSGIPFGSQTVHSMMRGDRRLRVRDPDVGRQYIREVGQKSLVDAGVWLLLMLTIVTTQPPPQRILPTAD